MKNTIYDVKELLEENKNLSNIDFAFEILDRLIEEQNKNVIEYLNSYLSPEEINIHVENICGYLVKPKADIASIKLLIMTRNNYKKK